MMNSEEAETVEAEEEPEEPGIGCGKLLAIGVGLFVAAFLAGVGGFWLSGAWRVDFDAPMQEREFVAEFVVRRGDTFNAIARAVVNSGLLERAKPLRKLAEEEGTLTKLQPGFYRVQSAASVRELHALLLKGAPVRVTFPEGFRLEQFAERLVEKNVLKDSKHFLDLASSTRWIQAETPLDGASLEGYLWPDTYDFVPGDKADAILKRLVENFAARTRELSRQAAPQKLKWAQVVILASMIEKEAGVDAEKPAIASVYYNRLQKDYKLQCDATVRYGLKVWGRGLTIEELKRDTPFNTYKYAGLPPGPICSPGLASLHAAVAPVKTSYLYYCAKGDGAHAFARSLVEHNRNVNKYLRR